MSKMGDSGRLIHVSISLACVACGLTMWMVPRIVSKIHEINAQLSSDMLEFRDLERDIWYVKKPLEYKF